MYRGRQRGAQVLEARSVVVLSLGFSSRARAMGFEAHALALLRPTGAFHHQSKWPFERGCWPVQTIGKVVIIRMSCHVVGSGDEMRD